MADLSALDFTKRGRLQEQLAVATEARQALSVRLSDLVDESATSSVSSSEAALRSRQTAEINAVSEKIEEVSNELEKALGDRKAANEDLNRRIAQEKAPVLRKREVQLTQAEEWREGRLKELENRSLKIQDLNSQISSRAAEMTSLRGEIKPEGRGNQVYRMAASYYDRDNIAELSPGEIAFVATVWFGSLATIVACAGIVLAFGSYAVKAPPKLKSNYRHTFRHLRMLIAAIKLQKRKVREVEVEVVKEVEVIKTIQVPGPERIVDREVKVREEVYVPVPATPAQLEALMKAESLSLAEGVAA